MKKQALLIGGCPRSGSTALIQLLNSNPQVYLSAEENLLAKWRGLDKLFDTQERRSKSLARGMRALSVRETLNLDNIQSHNFTRRAAWPMIRHLYRWHHQQMHGDTSLLLWGDKFPDYFRELDAVLQLPHVRYVHLTRNPLDVINSMLRRTNMAQQGLDWWKAVTDFNDMLDTWASAHAAIQAQLGKANILHLHYEDLIFDFETSVQRLNKFMELDLTYQNILITDPAKHFERTFLNPEQCQQILAHPEVKAYQQQCSPFVQRSMAGNDPSGCYNGRESGNQAGHGL